MPGTPAHRAAIALGSNLGDRGSHIRAASEALAALPGTNVIALSRVVETEPVGPVRQGAFLNAAAVVQTTLAPRALLAGLHEIERSQGRDRAREQRWGPRTLDLDLLLYEDRVINEPGLTVPHPRLHERLFVLEPLAEIAPDLIVPGLGRSIANLRVELRTRGKGP